MPSYDRIHPEHPVRRAVVAAAISLGVHAAALALLGAWALAALSAAKRAEATRPKDVILAPLSAAQWERNRGVTPQYVPSAAIDAGELARPERARFLADRDRRAERETVAAPAPGMPGRPAAAGPAAAPAAEVKPSTGATEATEGRRGEPLELAAEGLGPRQGAALPDLSPRPPAASRPLMMNFAVAGEGGVPELDGVAVGNLTVLNTEAWRYATFFDRVGATLYGVWRADFVPRPPVPSVAARPRGGTARVALGVTLDASGRAVEVVVRRSSGYADVDELLAELIRKSAPFPNVPPGLLDGTQRYGDVWIIGLVWGWPQR